MNITGTFPQHSIQSLNMESLTGIRFFAAIMVVVYHYGRTAKPFNDGFLNKLMSTGLLGVSFFFVLSGFILAMVYYHRCTPNGKVDVRSFFSARFARIYPVYLLAFAFTWGILIRDRDFPTDELALWMGKFISALFMVQSWIPGYALDFNGPGWSLAVEALFYLGFPFIFPMFRYISNRMLLVWGVGIWAAFFFLNLQITEVWFRNGNSITMEARSFFPLWHMGSFLIGMVLGVLVRRGTFHYVPKWLFTLGFILLTALLLNMHWLLNEWVRLSVKYLGRSTNSVVLAHNGVLAPLWGMFLVCMLFSMRWVNALFGNRIMRYLGEASFAIYILQYPLWKTMELEIYKYFPDLSITAKFTFFLLALILFSCAIFTFFESPLRKLIRNKLQIRKRADVLPTSSVNFST